jgi:hypothetical protein
LDFALPSLFRGRAFLGTLALCLTLSGIMATPVGSAQAELPRLGQRGWHRHRRQSERF